MQESLVAVQTHPLDRRLPLKHCFVTSLPAITTRFHFIQHFIPAARRIPARTDIARLVRWGCGEGGLI